MQVALQEGQAATQRDLARFAKSEQPSMAEMLARMERAGLIVRTPDPGDGRSSQVALTRKARHRVPEACAVVFAGNRDALTGFTPREADELTSLLTRLIANLD